MPSPFPGMNPYLEHPALWSKVHKRLIVALADSVAPQLRPKYIVDIEERVYQTSGEDSLEVLEEWVLVGIAMGHNLPEFDGATIKVESVA